MAKWKRPTGSLIETNDLPDTIIAATKAGWERLAEKPAKKPAAKKPAKK